MDAREALVVLNLLEGIGPVRVRQPLEFFGDATKVLQASRAALTRVKGIGDDLACTIVEWQSTTDLAGELKRADDFGARLVFHDDDEYPELLREIYDPPIVLYVKGRLLPEDKNSIAMVGARRTTHYGQDAARKLAYKLAGHGVTVVSGGARGIDSASHQGTLSAKGQTIAVLGTGINIVYPAENAKLYERIIENAEDILAEFEHLVLGQALGQADAAEPVPLANLTDHEQAVLDVLDATEQPIDTVIANSGLPVATVSVALLGLEMKRLARQLPGKLFARR